MMDADRQIVFVHIPQQLEDEFGEETRVCEDERGLVALDLVVQLRDRPTPGMPAPRHALFERQQDIDIWLRALLAFDQLDGIHISPRGKPSAKPRRVSHGGRQRHPLHIGRYRLQSAEAECEQIATLSGGEGMHFVHDDPLQSFEHLEAIGIAQQQREAFRRGQQDMRRLCPLAFLAVRRCVPAASFDLYVEPDLFNRREQISLHIMRQRLQRRDIERVQTVMQLAPIQPRRGKIGQRGQKPRQRLASTCVRHQQRMLARVRGRQHF